MNAPDRCPDIPDGLVEWLDSITPLVPSINDHSTIEGVALAVAKRDGFREAVARLRIEAASQLQARERGTVFKSKDQVLRAACQVGRGT